VWPGTNVPGHTGSK